GAPLPGAAGVQVPDSERPRRRGLQILERRGDGAVEPAATCQPGARRGQAGRPRTYLARCRRAASAKASKYLCRDSALDPYWFGGRVLPAGRGACRRASIAVAYVAMADIDARMLDRELKKGSAELIILSIVEDHPRH